MSGSRSRRGSDAMTADPRDARRPAPDPLLTDIADYVLAFDPADNSEAMETARLCLMDSLGCAMLALQFPACAKLLGPVVPGAGMPGGSKNALLHNRMPMIPIAMY